MRIGYIIVIITNTDGDTCHNGCGQTLRYPEGTPRKMSVTAFPGEGGVRGIRGVRAHDVLKNRLGLGDLGSHMHRGRTGFAMSRNQGFATYERGDLWRVTSCAQASSFVPGTESSQFLLFRVSLR